MESLYRANLPGQAFRLVLLVLRKTYGFQKKEDAISLSQMERETGIHHVRCSQLIKDLVLAQILTVSANINGIGKKYIFNKDFDVWDTLSANFNRKRKVKSTLSVKRNLPLAQTASTKETLTKEILQKKGNGIFRPPTIEEVAAYCLDRGNSVDPEKWLDHYTSNGWKVGKNPMKDWMAAVRTWEKSGFNSKPNSPTNLDIFAMRGK
jgi:phage replication O-like protein O